MNPLLLLSLLLVHGAGAGKPEDIPSLEARREWRRRQAQNELPAEITAAAKKRLESPAAGDRRPSLRFRADGTFKIVQFADAHVIDGGDTQDCKNLDWRQKRYPCSDKNTTALLDAMLDQEDPDLVVFTGDNIMGPDLQGNVSANLKALAAAFAPVIHRGYPWAAVFGNHDSEHNLNRTALMTWIAAQPFSLAVPGPDFGDLCVGNYVLDVLPAGDSATSLGALTLYLLDSRAYSEDPEVGGYDYIHQDQIFWYKGEAAARRAAATAAGLPGAPPALMFFHIPLKQYVEAFADGSPVGRRLERVCHSDTDAGLASALLEEGDVKVVSVGHDHNNEFCAFWGGDRPTAAAAAPAGGRGEEKQGLAMCYGGGSGYHGYGQPRWDRRSRVFLATASAPLFPSNVSIATLKRVDNAEDGLEVIDRQSLWPYGS